MTKIIDIKSLLIGFLLATSVMLFMGATQNVFLSKQSKAALNTIAKNGKYQGFGGGEGPHRMLNTQTGELYGWNSLKKHWNKKTKDENWMDWIVE